MFHRKSLSAALVLTAALLSGCGLGGGAAADGPDAAMSEFLEAIRQGNEEKASSMLTTLARQKAEEMEMYVAPPGSQTASYKILETEIEGPEAQVATDWTDTGEDGQPHTDRIVWMLRKEDAGWRIHGMANRVFADMKPVILNFEDPEDMIRQQEAVAEETARREARLDPQAESSGEDVPSIR